ncbi:MAG: calcium-binding hemolysin protein [Gallionellaceae bacterium]|nr:MAG: calcium-binding hemolysin protein [Gallionellaceae bacterium]
MPFVLPVEAQESVHISTSSGQAPGIAPDDISLSIQSTGYALTLGDGSGSNYGDRLSGANATLVGGAGGDTYSYQAGDGIVRIKDAVIAGDTNTLKFGAGITAGQIRLGLGSLKLDLGPSASSGQARDEIHLDGFNPDDAFNTSTIQRFEFDGGSTLTTAELLARGFDLDGTAGLRSGWHGGKRHHRRHRPTASLNHVWA